MAIMQNRVFPQRLNQIIVERGLYPSDVAKLTGVCKQKIYDYIKGTKEPRLSSFIKLARGLKVSADWLCGLEE